MSLDLNTLTLAQLKAELKQKNLETTGKKTDLVARLKAAMEEPSKEGEAEEEEEEEEEAQPDKQEEPMNTEESENNTTPNKARRWLHVLSRKYSAKIKHLSCVQKMSQKRKKKESLNSANSLRVRVYPLTPEDIGNPTISAVIRQCVSSQVNFFRTTATDGTPDIMGMLSLTFAQKSDIPDAVATLLLFKDDVYVNHSDSDMTYHDYLQQWRKYQHHTDDPLDKSLLICPMIPDEMGEDDVWKLFPRAIDINIVEKTKEKVMIGGKEVEEMQPRYAYVQFPSEDVSRKNMELLMDITPTAEMRKMCLIPFLKLVENNQDDKKEEAAKPKPAPAKPTPNVTGPKAKKGPGVVSTARHLPNQRSIGRSGYAVSKTGAVIRPRTTPAPQPPQHYQGYGQGPVMGQLQREASRRGPEEAHGMRMLNAMMTRPGSEWQDEEEYWEPVHPRAAVQRDYAGRSYDNQRSAYDNARGAYDNTRGYDNGGGYQDDVAADPMGLVSKIVSATRQLNEVIGKTQGGSSSGGRGMGRGRGVMPTSPGYGASSYSSYSNSRPGYGGDGYGGNQRY